LAARLCPDPLGEPDPLTRVMAWSFEKRKEKARKKIVKKFKKKG